MMTNVHVKRIQRLIVEYTTCSCATSKSCFEQAQMFYSKNCLRTLLTAMPIGGYDAEYVWTIDERYFQPIYAFSSRFATNEKIDIIAQLMFIDSWTFNVSYELFFNTCAPRQCSITYYYRFEALDVFTTFVSLFNGVSLVFRFLLPYFIRIFKKICNRFRVAPI